MVNRRPSSQPVIASEAQPQHGSELITIRNLVNDRELYENYPKFQRQYVWPLKFRRALIDSILRGAPIHAIFAYKARDENGKEKYYILDGHQRLSTIYDFCGGRLETWSIAQAKREEPNSLPPVEPGVRFHGMTERSQNILMSYKFTVNLIDYIDEAQLGMYYRRIQHHLPLKLGEKLASYGSKAITYALQLTEHPIWGDYYEGDRTRNEILTGSLSMLAIERKQGYTVLSSSSLHLIASGTKDEYMTQELYEAVVARLNVVMHVFDGAVFTRHTELVILYQAVQLLENNGCVFTTLSDKGRLTPWFGQIQAEGVRAGKRGFSYALGERMKDINVQSDFWDYHLPSLIKQCKEDAVSEALP